MLRDVKVAVHDYPKRSQMLRGFVTVTADTDDEALALARVAASEKWPGGKYVPFDVGKPYEPKVNAASINDLMRADKRPVLKAKKS